MSDDILSFCQDEVERQGFRRLSEEWVERVGWMVETWNQARSWSLPITVQAIEAIGRGVERVRNKEGLRKVGVRVGNHIAPPASEVRQLVAQLVSNQAKLTPDEFYLEFERIHPFVDGNGRSGKILHNWLLGTLEKPVLIKDYFGWGLP